MHYWLAGESSAAIDIYGAAIYYQLLSKFTLCYALPETILTYVSAQTWDLRSTWLNYQTYLENLLFPFSKRTFSQKIVIFNLCCICCGLGCNMTKKRMLFFAIHVYEHWSFLCPPVKNVCVFLVISLFELYDIQYIDVQIHALRNNSVPIAEKTKQGRSELTVYNYVNIA